MYLCKGKVNFKHKKSQMKETKEKTEKAEKGSFFASLSQ